MTINGYEQPWKIEAYLRALRQERHGRELDGDEATCAVIDSQVELFTAELKRLRKTELEEAAQRARELERELKEATK
jgi:hypothetical protein